jgi:perosamine synthetase
MFSGSIVAPAVLSSMGTPGGVAGCMLDWESEDATRHLENAAADAEAFVVQGESDVIQLFKPDIGEAEIAAVTDVLRSGWLGLGPKTAEFERQFSAYIGIKSTVGVNSGTSALDMALRLLQVSRGHEVIVPTFTFVSTAHVVAYNSATPVFADVDPNTLNISLDDVASKITRRTRAILPVHYGGRPVDIDALRSIAGGIPIIEDCAHACGSSLRGRKTGSLGEMGCFSFQAVKNLVMGDGGALTVHDPELAARAKRLRWLGIDKGTWDRTEGDRSYSWEYSVDEIGPKCYMNDLAAAIGLVQLARLDAMNVRRAEIARLYSAALANVPGVQTPPPVGAGSNSSWHIYCIKCERRDDLIVWLQERGISTGVHYRPIHTHRCYGTQPALETAERVFPFILSLPMYPRLTDGEVDRVVSGIISFYNR